jgi:5-formyltetrahydrofolate cyclo-ligase
MANFKLLREQIRIKLQNLTAESRALSDKNIATRVINSAVFIHSKSIASYLPIEYEVDTWEIIKNIWEQGKSCYLPALHPHEKNHLCFVKFMPDDPLLRVGKYKFLSPQISPEKIIAPSDLDLVIAPLMGFTGDRFRLGRGGGCYDRTFAFKKRTPFFIKPYLLGVGYECQIVEFEPNPWDVAMDEVVIA